MMLRQWTVAVQPTHTPWVITPTATPTTELEGDVYVLPNSHGYMDEGGGLHAVGEVQNDTGSILTDVLVTVHIYDDDGSWLASASNYVLLDRLLPGGHTCFHVYHEPIAGAYQFDIDSPDYSTTTEVPPSLVFTDHSARYDSGWIVIDGEVTNEEEQSVIDGRVVGAIYDAEYTVLGCEYCYLDNSDLGPGESSTFELTFTDRDYEDVLHYFIQAEGDWP